MAYTRQQRLILAVVPFLAAAFIRLLGATFRYRDINATDASGTLVPVGIEIPGPVVFAFWHRTLLTCAHRFRNKGIAILISPSFDGELIARTVEYLGFHPVRGSSSRGGASGLRNMAEAYNAGHRCAITADGPRGPNMVAKAGPVQLAELTGATWIGTYYALPNRAWELNSWDRFMIPKPFSTITFTWPPHCTSNIESVQASLDLALEMSAPSPDGTREIRTASEPYLIANCPEMLSVHKAFELKLLAAFVFPEAVGLNARIDGNPPALVDTA